MRPTPRIPTWIGEDVFQPHYTNIYALLGSEKLSPAQQAENRSRLYGTETLVGFNDWDAPTLLLAKDAGPMQTFRRLIESGDPQPWRHAQRGRDKMGWTTNERLMGFTAMLPGSKLYGSAMAGLLRNDGQLRGALPNFNSSKLRCYLRRVLEEFVLPEMHNLRIVLCLGNEACKVMGAVIGSTELEHRYETMRKSAHAVDFNGVQIFPAWHPVASEPGENVRRVWAAAAEVIRQPKGPYGNRSRA